MPLRRRGLGGSGSLLASSGGSTAAGAASTGSIAASVALAVSVSLMPISPSLAVKLVIATPRLNLDDARNCVLHTGCVRRGCDLQGRHRQIRQGIRRILRNDRHQKRSPQW